MAEVMNFDVVLGEKAVSTQDNGDLIIEGFAATWEKDREGWAFEPQSFVEAAKGYLASGGPLLVQHDPKLGGFGKVETAEVRDKGVWIRARVPEPAQTSPLRDWYQKVRDGIVNGLSVKGPAMIRKRADGTIAARMKDWIETSVTPVPVNTGGVLAVAQKAFDAGDVEVESAEDGGLSDDAREWFEERLTSINTAFDKIEERLPAVPAADDKTD